MGTSIARPLIRKKTDEIARKEKATPSATGSNGKVNDQFRFEAHLLAMSRNIRIMRPGGSGTSPRVRPHRLREEARHRSAGEKKKLQYGPEPHALATSGVNLEDPWSEPRRHVQDDCIPREGTQKANIKTKREITFDKGVPVAIDGKKMSAFKSSITSTRWEERTAWARDTVETVLWA
jgi:argininosuccinate synthase